MAGPFVLPCCPENYVQDHRRAVPATLRRINNARGHPQFRYETKQQAPLRDYFANVFGTSPAPDGVLRVSEVEPRVFLFQPVSARRQATATLGICNPHFHNCVEAAVREYAEFKELGLGLRTIPYKQQHSQSDYNRAIAAVLSRMGWSTETRIIEQIGLRCDFVKNGVWVEIEFGNARVYYQDYVKFLLALRHRAARLGVLLCPTNAFAQLLCDHGQQRAVLKRSTARAGQKPGRRPSYSGMMSHEKALREFPFLEFMLTAGIVVGGIEIQGQ